MQIVFMKWVDSAIIFVGSPLDAYRTGVGDPMIDAEEFLEALARDEVNYVVEEAIPGAVLYVGDML